MRSWIAALAEAASEGTPAVIVTVLRVAGSTPREAGAKMVVTAGAVVGSVGGGHLELTAVELARELLAAGTAEPVMRDFALGPSLGQCCGGKTTLLLEPVLPPRRRVAIFGAGHVGKALVKVLAGVPCRVTWIDGREAELPREVPPNVERVVMDPADEAVADLAPGCDVVVLTHDHALDLRIAEAVLRRGDQRSLGVIGSATKAARFRARLAERFPPEVVARMTCPVGVEGIKGKHPAVIAIAIAAQLLQGETP